MLLKRKELSTNINRGGLVQVQVKERVTGKGKVKVRTGVVKEKRGSEELLHVLLSRNQGGLGGLVL